MIKILVYANKSFWNHAHVNLNLETILLKGNWVNMNDKKKCKKNHKNFGEKHTSLYTGMPV